MAWRIDEQVVRGELDNRIKGKLTGTIWLAGRDAPLRLMLEGNPWRDWAGCALRFTHAMPQMGDISGLDSEQIGVCGDMTASRKVRIPPEPVSEWLAQGAPGEDSLPWGNALYIEWFSGSNGRVVIESTRYAVEISERRWSMSEGEELEQRRRNLEEMNNFMVRLEDIIEQTAEAERAESKKGDSEPDPEAEEREADRALELISEIEELKRKAREIAGGEMIEGSGERITPLDIQHQFWQNVVEQETEVLPPDSGWNCRICIHEYGVPGDEDGSELYLRYYANEEMRAHWAADFAEEILPHCDPPYDRDRHLPQ